jgi:integrase
MLGIELRQVDTGTGVHIVAASFSRPVEQAGGSLALSEGEIRIFWNGLDRDDLPWDRRTRLALKFELVTMLRSRELLSAHRDELFDLNGDNPRFDVPLKRVKKRRVIQQPLSDLAVEIIKEALASTDQQFVFESPMYKGQPIHRKAMADALRGTKYAKN